MTETSLLSTVLLAGDVGMLFWGGAIKTCSSASRSSSELLFASELGTGGSSKEQGGVDSRFSIIGGACSAATTAAASTGFLLLGETASCSFLDAGFLYFLALYSFTFCLRSSRSFLSFLKNLYIVVSSVERERREREETGVSK